MNPIVVALLALAGGITSSILGWLDSGESFIFRKFMASFIRSLVAGLVFAVGYSYVNGIDVMDMFVAFCGGAGVDALGNRFMGAMHRT